MVTAFTYKPSLVRIDSRNFVSYRGNRPTQVFAKNRTEPEPKCRGSYSVLSLHDIVGIFHTFHSKRGILLYLG